MQGRIQTFWVRVAQVGHWLMVGVVNRGALQSFENCCNLNFTMIPEHPSLLGWPVGCPVPPLATPPGHAPVSITKKVLKDLILASVKQVFCVIL